jgi:hypothetical protein
MCEFTVYLEKGGNREKITKNVVKAKLKDNIVTLMDSAGTLVKVENACILTVDTLMAELILKSTA